MRRSTLNQPVQVVASIIRYGDQVRFLEPRTDGEERYVVGRVQAAYSPQFGLVRLLVGGSWWNVTANQMIEVL